MKNEEIHVVKSVSWSTVKKGKKKHEATRGQKSFRRLSVL